MLNLALVKSFVTVAETGSFVASARELGIAQPTVSQQIRKLESILGGALIERTHAGCSLTLRGQSVLPHARALLVSAVRFTDAAQGDRISIGCSGNIASYYITEDLKRFIEHERGELRWEITGGSNPEILELISSGCIDIGAMEWPAASPGIETRRWRVEPLVVILPPGHPLAAGERITVEQLLALDLIGGEPGSGTGMVLQNSLGERASALRITHTLPGTEAVKSAVKAGLGCSIVLAGAARDEIATGSLVALHVEGITLEKVFHVAFPAGLPEGSLPARLATFLSMLVV